MIYKQYKPSVKNSNLWVPTSLSLKKKQDYSDKSKALKTKAGVFNIGTITSHT